MRRREFVGLVAGAWPLSVTAQHRPKVWRIGLVLGPRNVANGVDPFVRGLEDHLARLGYVAGQNIALSYRFVEVPGVQRFVEEMTAIRAMTGTG